MTNNHEITLRYDRKLVGMLRSKLTRMRMESLLTESPFGYESFRGQPSRLCALSSINEPAPIIVRPKQLESFR